MAGLNLRGLEIDFFHAAGEHRLVYSKCGDCGKAMFPLRNVCMQCGASGVELTDSAGRGELLSVSSVMRPTHAAFQGIGPYRVGIVALDEGFHMLSNIDGDCEIGDRLEVFFVTADDGQGLPLFRKGL